MPNDGRRGVTPMLGSIPMAVPYQTPRRQRTMVGRTYLYRAPGRDEPEPVTVIAQWAGRGMRNVLIERADGTRAVVPSRPLRRPPAGAGTGTRSLARQPRRGRRRGLDGRTLP